MGFMSDWEERLTSASSLPADALLLLFLSLQSPGNAQKLRTEPSNLSLCILGGSVDAPERTGSDSGWAMQPSKELPGCRKVSRRREQSSHVSQRFGKEELQAQPHVGNALLALFLHPLLWAEHEWMTAIHCDMLCRALSEQVLRLRRFTSQSLSLECF